MSTAAETSLARELHRLLRVLAGLTLVFVVLLAWAPAKAWFSEWRDIQLRHVALAATPIEPGLRQIWRPEVDLVDRCTSCHLGMGQDAPIAGGGPLFGPHPVVHHDVGQMGCTICHLGQGRATTSAAAHGRVKHWESPMLPRAHLQASCGFCHGDSIRVPSLAALERAEQVQAMSGCSSCHDVGLGGAPDLSAVGVTGYAPDWAARHAAAGGTATSFGRLGDEETRAIELWLDTRVGAPQLVRGKTLAMELGCRGCHKIGEIGGDTGPDLTDIGSKHEVDLDFAGVEGPCTAEAWHRAHLRDPARVSPGSRMPAYRGLSAEDEDALITFLLSSRRPAIASDHLPKATVLARLAVRRDFAGDGETLYRVFCASCHGAQGEGAVLAGRQGMIPAVGNLDFLSIASPHYLRTTLALGRPGRDMPGWTTKQAGLSGDEVEAILAALRARRPVPPSFEDVQAAPVDLELGRDVYLGDCSGCHGVSGEGTVIAPSVINPELLFVADDQFLYRTITEGRADTAMPAHGHYPPRTLASLIGWLRSHRAVDAAAMRKTVTDKLYVRTLSEYRATGSAASGAAIYSATCAGCHGPDGQGGVGNAIANADFLRHASDGLIAGSIILGRGERAMRPFGGADGLANLGAAEIGDLITWLRREGAHATERPRGRHVQGTASIGAVLYASYCVGCHGDQGLGASAPALNNAGFLAAATDGYLQATIARGRRGTSMRGWARGGFGFAELDPQEINDIVAYVATWRND